MHYFFDSSALVKLFLHEQGSEAVTQLVENTPISDLTCSALASLEIRSAIQRKALFNETSPLLAAQALHLLQEEMERWTVIPISPSVLALAAQAIDRQAMRALDAIQLGTALSVSDETNTMTFVASDTRLLTAAQAAGLRTLNPQQ